MKHKGNRAGQEHSMPVYGDHYLGVMAFDHVHYAHLSSWNMFAEYEIVRITRLVIYTGQTDGRTNRQRNTFYH